METALLTARPHVGRALTARFLLILGLATVFFLLLRLDLALIGAVPAYSTEIAAAVLFVLLALDLVASFIRLKRTTYAVFSDRIAVMQGQDEAYSVPHHSVNEFRFSRNPLDKAFNTIQLRAGGRRFAHLPNENQFLFALQKAVQDGQQSFRPRGKKRAW